MNKTFVFSYFYLTPYFIMTSFINSNLFIDVNVLTIKKKTKKKKFFFSWLVNKILWYPFLCMYLTQNNDFLSMYKGYCVVRYINF